MKYKSYSREHQDFFVVSVLNGKKNGTYLEVGSAWPIRDSNTFLLENNFDWTGISIDNDENFVRLFTAMRKNKCILSDAIVLDYTEVLRENNLAHVDYLQLDIDPPDNTFKVLQKINFDKNTFSVITYEHDYYAGGKREREESRKIIQSHGYTMVLSDVMHDDVVFEDWYINEKYMPNDNWKSFIGNNVNLNPSAIDEKYKTLFYSIMDTI